MRITMLNILTSQNNIFNKVSYILHLTGSETYYIGIVDASYNVGRPRPNQASLCHYVLRVWSGECVYWDDVVDEWSASGCCLHESSTFELAQCRCVIRGSHASWKVLEFLCLCQPSGRRHYVFRVFMHAFVHAWVPNNHCWQDILGVCWWNLIKLSPLTDFGARTNKANFRVRRSMVKVNYAPKCTLWPC